MRTCRRRHRLLPVSPRFPSFFPFLFFFLFLVGKQLLIKITVFQILAGAFAISAAQSGFANRLISSLATTSPSIPPILVIGTGAADLRTVFPPNILPGIVLSYLEGLRTSFIVAIAFAGVSFLASFVLPWQRLHSKPAGEMMMA